MLHHAATRCNTLQHTAAYLYIHMCLCIHTQTYVYLHDQHGHSKSVFECYIYPHIYVYLCAFIYICIFIYTYIYTYKYIYKSNINAVKVVSSALFEDSNTYKKICTCMYTCTDMGWLRLIGSLKL